MKRGKIKTRDSELIAFWLPRADVARLDQRVEIEDLDRSKWIRRAIQRQLGTMGISVHQSRSSAVATALTIAASAALLFYSAHAPEAPDQAGITTIIQPAFAGGLE